jgi:hypothetical protein
MNDNANNGGSGGLNPEDFEAFMRQFLSGNSGIDNEQLAKAAGLPSDPAALAAMMEQLKSAMSSLSAQGTNPGVNWEMATAQAEALLKPEPWQFRITQENQSKRLCQSALFG